MNFLKNFCCCAVICIVLMQAEAKRILGVFPHFGYSHFKVFYPLLHNLSEKGHNVTVITYIKTPLLPKGNYEELLLEGVEVVNVVPLVEMKARTWKGLFDEYIALHNEGQLSCKRLYNSGHVEEVLKRHQQQPYDLVITEYFNSDCQMALPYLMKIPVVALSSCLVMPWYYDRILMPDTPSFVQSEFVGFRTPLNWHERFMNFVQAKALSLLYRYYTNHLDNKLIKHYLNIEVNVAEIAKQHTRLIFGNQHYSLMGIRPFTQQFKEIGGIHINEQEVYKVLPPQIDLFLKNTQKDVIFISWGSMIRGSSLDQNKLQAILNVLKKLDMKIIWKWETDDVPIESTQFLFVKWAPQLTLMCHPKIKLFWGHGGLLSTTEAVYCGKSMILTPIYGDQFVNGFAVENRKIGRVVNFNTIDEETLEEEITRVMHFNLYSIIAPNTLRPNSQYHVAVSIHKAPEPAKVKVGIIGSAYIDFKTVEIRPFSTEMIHFEIPSLKRDRYNLTAEGLTGIRFTNETRLNFDAKQFTVMVQSDKAIYKPKDIVHYRVLIMDANLKPVVNYERVQITIRDAGNNVIRKYKDVRLTSGVYANDLELSDYPKFGEWSVEVEVMDETYKRTFEVVEYILPKFVVDIITDKHVNYKDGKIRTLVKAYYDFGKPIVGEATLSIYPTFFGSLQPFVNDLITRKVVPIDGSAYFEFDIRNELKLKEDYEREYLLDALVEETSTSSVQNFSTVITVHLDAYRVEAVKLPSNYIPGVPFEVSAKVLRNDGAMMKDFKPELTAYLTNGYGSSEMYNKTEYTLDTRSEVKMKFSVPVEDKDEYHSVIVNYQGIITDIGKIPRKHLHSKNYITAKVVNDKPIINQEITIAVRCSEPMKYFIYQIVGRGDILLSRAVDVADNSYHTFKFLSTFAMMPRAKLLVYMVINGEFVYDEQVIEFEENLLNNVQVEAPLKAPPGQDIDITISSKPYNYIGLMVVDQNALNIRKGNDLSTSNLMRALNQYELNDFNTPIGSPGKESGVIAMSNTDFIIEKEPETTPALGRAINEDEHKLTTIRKTDIGPAHAIETNTLAPGKGRYAFSYTPKPFWHNPRIHVMHPPVDTWLFMNVSAGSEGKTTIHRRLPSSMTSWVVSAFALDPVQGIGLTSPVKIIRTFKEFYITTELPYSIRIGETIAVPFVVFNNKDSALDVDVTLYNTAQEFDFSQIDSKAQLKPKIELYSRRSVRVLAKSSKSVAFIITPKRVGPITIKAVASNQLAGDSVESILLVEHPGATEIVNKGFLFEMGSSVQRKANVSINIPRNSIADSAKIEISAVGDVVGSILGNLENLIRLPSGCGEQTMIQFMPNLMVLQYLQRTRQISPTLEMRAKKNLELGYQRLLYYRHKNGGFSAFGLNEEKSSTWLTAYVAKVFRTASEFIQIDDKVITTALNFVVGKQTANGGFEEQGDIFEQFDDKNLSLSAFVTLALIENVNHYPQYKNNINKALDFITRSLDGSNSLHAMAIGTFVLSKANHESKVSFVQRLDAMSVNKDGMKWWNKTAPNYEAMSPWYNMTRSVNVEISSYAVLALLENNLIGDALPVLKWLMNQRNDLGGFVSSQDSVVGLQALVAFAERFSSQANNLQLLFNYGQNAETVLNVNAQNSLVLQTIELPNNLKNLTVSATGNGLALAQVTYRYNTNVTSAWPRFVLDPTVNRNSHSDYLHLSACASFIQTEGDSNQSNMAVMEIYLPSGFVVDTDTLPTLESSNRIKKVETQKRNTVVIIYFDYLDRREVCPTLHAYKVVKVTNHKLVPVIMYDYYDNVRRARQFYRAPKSQICDICEHANCGELCEKAEKRESRRLDPDTNELLEGRSAVANVAVNTILMLLVFVLFKIIN